MPGIATVPETGGGLGKVYLDNSGGYLLIAVAAKGYLMTHKYHVAPFSAVSEGAYSSVGTEQETTVQETAANLVAMIAACYKSTATVQALGAYQVQSDHQSVLPVAIDLSAATSPGTNGASSDNPVDVLYGLTGHGTDFSKWQTHLHACAGASPLDAGRIPAVSLGSGGVFDLAQYFVGLGTGVGISGLGAGLKTQVVTHSGAQLAVPLYMVGSVSRRIRRRYRWL